MTNQTLLREITEPASRPNPFPLYARLRETPVCRQDDGVYVVSTHREVTALLHDPRVSSDPRTVPGQPVPPRLPFIAQDGADHDRLRRLTMRQFGPPHTHDLVSSYESEIVDIVDALVGDLREHSRVDIVESVAYPLPVKVICRLLGVPQADEPRFHQWADDLVRTTGALDQANAEELLRLQAETRVALFLYMQDLIARHRREPSDCMLSRLANEDIDEPMSDDDLATTGILLLVAGHETTVNLITNGMLTLLRHPEVLDELCEDDELAIPVVEELLRFEAPVQYLPNRSARDEIVIADSVIPPQARIVLLLASASRDPDRFADPDRFDPHRPDNQHFGFGGGIHYCFGAPLARLETQHALAALTRRLVNPRLVEDSPPYRPSPVLRGPSRLLVDLDAVRG